MGNLEEDSWLHLLRKTRFGDKDPPVGGDVVPSSGNGKVTTTPFTLPMQVILNASEVLGSSKKKKEVENGLLYYLVPLTFESCNKLKCLILPD